MKNLLPMVLLIVLLITIPISGQSQQLSDKEIKNVIAAFTTKETEFRQALIMYKFRRDALIQTLGFSGQVTGQYRRVSDFVFDDKGNKFEKITFFPPVTLQGLTVTQEDLDDLAGIQPFALEASQIDKYNFVYKGTEHIDELNTYIFDVSPKVKPDAKKTKERFFQGTVWVEDEDLQIVKTRGQAVPETDSNKFPVFETYRENIDGKYWFPTYTIADTTLEFKTNKVHMKMLVRYSDFSPFKAKVKITEIDGPGLDEPTPTPTPAPVLKKP